MSEPTTTTAASDACNRTVLLLGATGFLGRALTLALRREGQRVVAWVRSIERARAQLGDQAELHEIGSSDAVAALARCDAVVNLAGEPVLSRWTAARRAALRTSRVELSQRLVAAIGTASVRPRVLVSASAVGFFGDRGLEPLDEASAPGHGFLPELCADWEAAARRAEMHGLRVVHVRTGVVLGLDGGALPRMLPPFRLGLGGRLGSGRQLLPWIHVEDWTRLVLWALTDPRCAGPVNACAPAPVTNRDFTSALAAAVGRRAPLPVPAAALRLLFGRAASILLESQRALPRRALELGFAFRFPGLELALRDLLIDARPAIEAFRGERPSSAYLAARPPSFELRAVTRLRDDVGDVFRFFSAPENLGLLTPRAMGFRSTDRSGPPAAGSTIDHRIRIGLVPIRWRSRFEAWEPGRRFVDVQERGPYRSWWHEHRFEPAAPEDGSGAAGTTMTDRVLYSLPLGPLGRLAQRCFVADQLGDVFAQRALAIRLRFGRAGETPAQPPYATSLRTPSRTSPTSGA